MTEGMVKAVGDFNAAFNNLNEATLASQSYRTPQSYLVQLVQAMENPDDLIEVLVSGLGGNREVPKGNELVFGMLAKRLNTANFMRDLERPQFWCDDPNLVFLGRFREDGISGPRNYDLYWEEVIEDGVVVGDVLARFSNVSHNTLTGSIFQSMHTAIKMAICVAEGYGLPVKKNL